MRELAVGPSPQSLPNNPLVMLGSDKAGNYTTEPYEVTDAILFGAVRNFLKILKDTTGIDLDVGNWLKDLPTFGEWLASLKVKAENIFGRPNPNIFSWLPIESLIKRPTEYLNNPLFDSAECLIDGDRWVWDGGNSYPEDDINGAAKGSVYIDANGDLNELCSNPVDVEEGQEVNCSIMTKWGNGFVSTGNSISLVAEGLYLFEDQAVVMDEEVLEFITSPGAIGDWEELSGTYALPSGCNAVRLVLRVDGTATAGRVWFSYGSLTKRISKGLFGIDIISGLKNALSNLDNFVQDLVGFIGWAIDGIFHPFQFLRDIGDLIESWFTDTQITAGEASDAKGGLADLIDAILKGWNKESAPGAGWSFPGLDVVFGLSQSKSDELSAIAAGLAQLEADLAGQTNSGVTYRVDFSTTPGVVPPEFTKFYDSGSGTVYNDGNTLQLPNNTGLELFVYNQPLLTQYPKTTLIVPKNVGDYFGIQRGAVWFINRANHPTAPTEFCFSRFDGKKVRFGCVKPGYTPASPYWFGPEQNCAYSTYMSMIAGIAGVGNERDFQMIVNGRIVGREDVSAVSANSPAHLYTGFGIEHAAIDAINRSPTISHFITNDNEPADTVGSYCKLYRSLGGSVSVAAGAKFPANFFDQLGRVTPEFEPIAASGGYGGVRVKEAGPYVVEVSIKKNSAIDHLDATEYCLELFLDNVIAARGGAPMTSEPDRYVGSGNGTMTTYLTGLSMTKRIYCDANDVITLGSGSAQSLAVTGSSDTISTYMVVAKG